MWVSGPYGACTQCHSTRLHTHDERFDCTDHIVVGSQDCQSCGAKHLFSRKATREEISAAMRAIVGRSTHLLQIPLSQLTRETDLQISLF